MLRRDSGEPSPKGDTAKVALSEQEEMFGCLVKPVALNLLWDSDTDDFTHSGWGEGWQSELLQVPSPVPTHS